MNSNILFNEDFATEKINIEKNIKLSNLKSSINIWDDASSDDDINYKQKNFDNQKKTENIQKIINKKKNFDNPWDAIEEITNKLNNVNESIFLLINKEKYF